MKRAKLGVAHYLISQQTFQQAKQYSKEILTNRTCLYGQLIVNKGASNV
jgi:hypothetical protein